MPSMIAQPARTRSRRRPRASGEAPCRNTESPCYASKSAPQRQRYGNGSFRPCPWASSPRRSNQILHDRRGGGTSPRLDTYGPQVDRGRRSHRAPNRRCRTDRRTRSPGVFSFTSRRLIADCSPELSLHVKGIWSIGNSFSTYITIVFYARIPEYPP